MQITHDVYLRTAAVLSPYCRLAGWRKELNSEDLMHTVLFGPAQNIIADLLVKWAESTGDVRDAGYLVCTKYLLFL